MEQRGIVFLAIFTLCTLPTPGCTNKYFRLDEGPKHLLVAPSQFIAGVSNKLCISRFQSATHGIAVAQIELLKPSLVSEQLTINTTRRIITKTKKILPEGNGGCLHLFIPKTNHRKAILHFRMSFEKLSNYKVNSRKIVSISQDANIIVVQTNKPIYRAGETVKFRVLQLKTDLTPIYIPIFRVHILAPPDVFGGPVKIAQWSNLTTHMGVWQRDYKLSPYAQLGEWRIVVDNRNPTIRSTEQLFQVTDYVLPSFYVTVDYQRNILRSYKQLLWTICARYMYGEAVKGTLHVNVKSDSINSQPIYFKTAITSANGCYNHTVRTRTFDFESMNEEFPNFVIADISFQEDGTKIWKNTTAMSNIKNNIVNIEFINNNNNMYKTGLLYSIDVNVTDWDAKPVADASVEFCKIIRDDIKMNYVNTSDNIYRNATRRTKQLLNKCEIGTTDHNGIVSFIFTIPNKQYFEYVELKAKILKHSRQKYESIYIKRKTNEISLILYSWGNKSKINMDIGSPVNESSKIEPGMEKVFPIFLSYKSDLLNRRITLHYLIVTRSGTLFYWGISSQCIHPIHDIQNIQTIYGPSFSEADCIDYRHSDTGVYKTMLNIKISHQMCPYSYLIVYFMNSEGEFVVANKRINVNDCFVNKVTKQWVPNTVSPSSSVKLHVNSNGPALCLFDATNIALSHVTPMTSVYEDVIEKLNQFIDTRHKRILRHNSNNICYADHSAELNDESSRRLFENVLKSFQDTGLELFTDIIPETKTCPNSKSIDQYPESYYLTRNVMPKERFYFPETWLWEARSIDSSGSVDISAIVPDDITTWDSQVYCISRHGFATSYSTPETTLKVFQPFFINLSIPSVIKRGENIKIYYQIYNYLDYDVPVESGIDINPRSAAEIVNEKDYEQIVCIPSKQSRIVYVSMKAKHLGNAKVSVYAQLKNSLNIKCSPKVLPMFVSYDTRDTVIKKILIEPEGIPVENYKSAILCTNEITNTSEVSWTLERDHCVDDSEKWFISFVGDIAGPMNMNIEKLISMPMGCGEQNMVTIAYNFIALEYSMLKKRASGDMKEAAVNNLMSGYQKQLKYRHPDTGAFSAFGMADREGSTWLTTFCIKYLSLLKDKYNIGAGNDVIESAAAWLLGKQMENGCFSNEGHVFHTEFKGGFDEETSNIAAYIAISLIDANLSFVKQSVYQNLLYCLAAHNYNASDNDKVYSFVLATLARIKIEKYYNAMNNGTKNYTLIQRDHILRRNRQYINKDAALTALKNIAKRNGDMIWWEAGSLSSSIESTAYAILSLIEVGGDDNILTAMSAAKWLSMYRNPHGGFISTQDTLVGIEALCALSYALPDNPPSMSVIVEITKRKNHFTINPMERYRLHTIMAKSIDTRNSPTTLKIEAYGKGCVLIQATQRYNKMADDAQNSSFGLFVKSTSDGAFDCKENEVWCKCAVTLEICVSWNSPTGMTFPDMAILEIELPTGYSSDRTLLYSLMTLENILLKRIEESTSENKVFLYLSPSSKLHSLQPKECYNLYIVGAKSYTLPAVVKVYDYYRPDISQSTMYSIPEECPNADDGEPHIEPINQSKIDEYVDNADASYNETDMMSDFHVIDSSDDLEVPKTIEGVPPVYVLPPKDFDVNRYSGIVNIYAENTPIHSFQNWTHTESETDLEFSERRRR